MRAAATLILADSRSRKQHIALIMYCHIVTLSLAKFEEFFIYTPFTR